jgi:hypothetical protein
MNPVSPVMPGSEPIEIVLGKDQPEYIPIPAVYLSTQNLPMVTRWRFDDAERAAIAAGADIVYTQWTFGLPFHPMHLQVTMPDAAPELIEE